MRLSRSALFLCLTTAATLVAGCGADGDPTTATGPEALHCGVAPRCEAVDDECLGTVDNAAASRFGLRMSELDVTRPAELTDGTVGRVVAGAVQPANPSCRLYGSGTFSWLLRFDLAAGTLETGGAKPVTEATAAYAFVDEEVRGFQVGPRTYALVMGEGGAFSVPAGQDLVLPMYLDEGATQVVVLPIRAARFTVGVLSGSQNCIGSYNAAGLEPANSCLAAEGSPAYLTAASVEGIIGLEDADRVGIDAFSETLCARLAHNDPAFVTTDSAGTTVCKRDAGGKILFPGDACVAGGTCADGVVVEASFAASSVRIEG
jgi:hypothetical protein